MFSDTHLRPRRARGGLQVPCTLPFPTSTNGGRKEQVRSEKSIALVGGGFPEPAPRSANLDSAFGGMQLFAKRPRATASR